MGRTIRVNGTLRTIEAEPDTPLLWVIREELKLTGSKYGCGIAQCGACTVHIDGQAMRSCSVPVSALADQNITTIESVSGPEADAILSAWVAHEVPQCGFCQSGQIMSAVTLLQQNKSPSDDDIDVAMNGNICRCATYVRIRAAIHTAAKTLQA